MSEEKKNPEGRPPLYTDPAVLQAKIDEYFKTGVNVRKVLVGKGKEQKIVELPIPTITGLCLHCGFVSRQSFYDYEKHPEFSDTIKRARMRIEQEYEEHLQCGLGAGAIFALKNFGWKDKSEHELSGPDGQPLPSSSPVIIFTDKEDQQQDQQQGQ
jgi:hypothetical protein